MHLTNQTNRRNFIKCAVGATAAIATGTNKSWAAATHPGNVLRIPPTFTNGGNLTVSATQLEI